MTQNEASARMASEKKRDLLLDIKSWSEAASNLVSLIRDLAIVLIVGFLVWNPNVISDIMRDNGIESLDILGIAELKRAKEEVETASISLETVQQSNSNAQTALDRVIGVSPDLAQSLGTVREALIEAEQSAEAAARSIESASENQQEALVQTGWVSRNLLNSRRATVIGTVTEVSEPKNLRVRSGPGTDHEHLTSIPPGTKVEVLEGPVGAWVRIRTLKEAKN